MALADKVTQFNSDADLVHEVVHGDATTVVQTESGPVKSLAKLLADSQSEIDAQTSLRTDLAAAGGAAMVGTKDGSTVQAKLDALGGGAVKSVNGTAPDAGGNLALTSDAVAEGQNNQYFTVARVLATVLQGLDTSRNAVITSADTTLSSLGKLQKQISDWIAAKDASSGYPGLTLFKINFRNAANTFTSFLANAATAVRTYTFPDKDITVAGTTNETHINPTIKGYIEQFQALNPGASVTVDPQGGGTLIKITTTVASTIVTLPARVSGVSYTIIVKYGATGHTITFTIVSGGGTLTWTNNNTIPTATSAIGKRDIYVFMCDDESTIGRDGGRGA